MKKVIEFLKWPWAFPVSILGVLYIYWFLSSPMDFDSYDDNYNAFLLGIILFIVYIFFTILLKLVGKDWILFSLFLFFALPFLAANIIYCIAYFPRELEKVELGNFKYYILPAADLEFHGLDVFYKCKKWSFNCDILFSSYGLTGTKIIVDEQQNEASLFELGFSRLLYTDGENPRTYTGFSSQLQDHMYQLSDKCNNLNNDKGYYSCETYTYTLYRCNLDYTLCNPLPIEYTSDFDTSYLTLEPNETSNEINLYYDYEDPPILIFTYGENPRCYVEGCEILEK